MSDLPHWIEEPPWTEEVDCEGLLCPLPVLRAAKRLRTMARGDILCVRTTDRMAAIDLPHFCTQSGHDYLGTQPEPRASSAPVTLHLIRRGPRPVIETELQTGPETETDDG